MLPTSPIFGRRTKKRATKNVRGRKNMRPKRGKFSKLNFSYFFSLMTGAFLLFAKKIIALTKGMGLISAAV
jgi:hypothetical protein